MPCIMATHNRYILMFEDDSDDMYFTESTMSDLGLDVPVKFELFTNSALENIRVKKPSLIILGYNAYHRMEILRKIRSVVPHVPVVILSENVSSETIQNYYQSGANSVIIKPSTVEDTRTKIQTFFNYWLNVAEL